jgi:hypothetical protein
MEDNIYELSKAWKQLDESFTRLDEKKADIPKKPGSGHIGKQGKAGPHDNKKWAEHKGFKSPKHKNRELDENSGPEVDPWWKKPIDHSKQNHKGHPSPSPEQKAASKAAHNAKMKAAQDSIDAKYGKKGKELGENAGAGATTSAGANPGSSAEPYGAKISKAMGTPTGKTPNIAPYARKLGEKKKTVKENFDIATLAGPHADEGEIEPETNVESPAVSDIIASLQARYPGAVIEITVTAPEGHCFTDADVATATEVANATEEPEELGGAWEKSGGEGEEGEEEEMEDADTKPLAESYPPSFGKSEEGEEEEDTEEENNEGAEETEGNEGEEGEVETASGITKDSISLSPECWSSFLVKADSQSTEETGEIEEGHGPQHGMGDSSREAPKPKLSKGADGKVTDDKGGEYEDNGEGYYRRKK